MQHENWLLNKPTNQHINGDVNNITKSSKLIPKSVVLFVYNAKRFQSNYMKN